MNKIPKWFTGAKLNFTENLLRRNDEKVAVFSTNEASIPRISQVSFRELNTMVKKCAFALQKIGVKAGDCVAAYSPNCLESLVMLLASAAIGAIFTSTSPDFGPAAVLERFQQTKPIVLFSTDTSTYNGKQFEHIPKLEKVLCDLNSVRKVIILQSSSRNTWDIRNSESFESFIDVKGYEDFVYPQFSFDHPLYILYSSGTTGKPKCLVHSAGGTLIQHAKEHILHGNMSSDDVFFQYTSTGWMMWPWMVSALFVGSSIVLYDGSPLKPQPESLWELINNIGVTIFGTSAKYIQHMEEISLKPKEKFSLDSLRAIYSTGSPLSDHSFDYVYSHIKGDLCLASITGGTDIISLFAGMNMSLPVYRGEIQCRCLGMSIEARDSSSHVIFDVPGELVCVKPFPSMPVKFWNDESGERYFNSYFNGFEGVWTHGDFVCINSSTKGIRMLGRSDGTLNPAGVRFGSADLYDVLTKIDWIDDSLAVGYKKETENDERVVLFLKLKETIQLDKEKVEQVKIMIRNALSARHVPAYIMAVPDIPYTVNGKKVEVAVKNILAGKTVLNLASLANPESLEFYKNVSFE